MSSRDRMKHYRRSSGYFPLPTICSKENATGRERGRGTGREREREKERYMERERETHTHTERQESQETPSSLLSVTLRQLSNRDYTWQRTCLAAPLKNLGVDSLTSSVGVRFVAPQAAKHNIRCASSIILPKGAAPFCIWSFGLGCGEV